MRDDSLDAAQGMPVAVSQDHFLVEVGHSARFQGGAVAFPAEPGVFRQ